MFRTMFSFLSEINLRTGTQPSTIQKLFGAPVKPTLIYNCEEWGAFLKSKSNTSFEKFQTILFDDKFHHELLHNCLHKHLLGWHSKESNFAVRGELGCYPFDICLYTTLFKFFSIFLKSLKAIHSLRIHSNNVISCLKLGKHHGCQLFHICCNL